MDSKIFYSSLGNDFFILSTTESSMELWGLPIAQLCIAIAAFDSGQVSKKLMDR